MRNTSHRLIYRIYLKSAKNFRKIRNFDKFPGKLKKFPGSLGYPDYPLLGGKLLYPLRALGRSSNPGYRISGVVLVLSSLPILVQIAIDSRDVAFDYRSFMCTYLSSAPIWTIASPMIVGLFMLLPNLIVIGTSIALLRVIKKTKYRVKQGIRTTLYVGLGYIIVNGPMTFHLFTLKNASKILPAEVIRFYENNLFRSVFFFTFCNCSLNFFVYHRSVKSFNVFVRKVFRRARCFFISDSFDADVNSYRLRRVKTCKLAVHEGDRR